MRASNTLNLGVTARQGYWAFRKRRQRLKVTFNITLALLILLISIALQAIGPVHNAKAYQLSPAMKQLAGDSREDSSTYLKQDPKTGDYKFEVPKVTESKEHTGRNTDAYSVSFATDPKQGISYTDAETNITLKLIPKFFTQTGQRVEGDHVVYPFGPNKLTYTLKYNGLKEDIILPTFQGNSLEYRFEFVLPSGVEARLDKQGNIGIYSADTTLYGNISYGSEKDQELIDKARENGQKTHLVATIPYPIVKDANGKEHTDLATFRLDKARTETTKTTSNPNIPAEVQAKLQSKSTQHVYDLKLRAKNLKSLSYPISIDPTLTSGSAADFSNVNPEGNTEIDNTGLIKRANLTGGSVGSWTQDNTNSLPEGRAGAEVAVYNGYIYLAGDDPDSSGSSPEDIYYAKLNGNGGITGSWTVSPNFWSTTIGSFGFVAYNGYLYKIGGNGFKSSTNVTEFAKLDSEDGSVGTWATTSAFSTARGAMATSAYNGYLYIVGGVTAGANGFNDHTWTYRSDIQYAKINGDGSLAAWASAGSNFGLSARAFFAGNIIYNGYLYAFGGCNGSTTGDSNSCLSGSFQTNGQYVKLNSDGTVGSWVTLTSMPAITRDFASAYKGYLYAWAPGSFGIYEGLMYAPIHASGAIGSWQSQTVTHAFTRTSAGTIAYNGYLTTFGGRSSGGTPRSTVEFTAISPAGRTGSYDTPSSNATYHAGAGRTMQAATVYNGYLYVSGGCSAATAGICTTINNNNVRFASISSDGSVGAWATFAGSFTGRFGHTMGVYNGIMWVIGGCTAVNGSGFCTTPTNTVHRSSPIQSDGNNSGGWTAVTALPTARTFHSSYFHNGYIYVIGGCAANTTGLCTAVVNTDTVQIGTISGATVSWAAGTTTGLTIPVGAALTASGGYLYVIGGCTIFNGSGVCTTISSNAYYISINPSTGAMGSSWTPTASLNTARFLASAVSMNGYIYVVGGCVTHTARLCDAGTTSVESSVLASNGAITDFDPNTAMGTAYAATSAVHVNGFLFTLGGCTGAAGGACTGTDAIRQAQVNNGGSGSIDVWAAWNPSSPNNLMSRGQSCSAAIDGYLFAIGGTSTGDNEGVSESVQYANIASDGSVGNWSNPAVTSDDLPVGIWRMGCTTYNGYIYLVGGSSIGGARDTVVYTKPVNGVISSWTTDSHTFSTAAAQLAATAYNGYLYMLGGRSGSTGTTALQFAQLDSTNGSIVADNNGCVGTAAWCTPATTFSGNRFNPNGIAYNGYLYVLGGCATADGGGNCTTYVSDVQFAKLDTTGNLVSDNPSCSGTATWCYTTSFEKGMHNSTAVALNGYLYLPGGDQEATSNTATRYIAILSNGQLGARWQHSAVLGAARYHASVAEYRGTVYVVGGNINGGSVSPITYYGKASSIPRVAQFSKQFDFDTGVRPTKLITRGTKQSGSTTALNYMNTNNTGATYGTAISSSDIGYNGANALTLNLGTNIALSRYFWLRYTIDDTYSGVFPDTTQSDISEFDLYYTANPGMRLRNGRTFTNGINRGLNANP